MTRRVGQNGRRAQRRGVRVLHPVVVVQPFLEPWGQGGSRLLMGPDVVGACLGREVAALHVAEEGREVPRRFMRRISALRWAGDVLFPKNVEGGLGGRRLGARPARLSQGGPFRTCIVGRTNQGRRLTEPNPT
eukprot:1344105-Pyramimonas_sp.AAC.3